MKPWIKKALFAVCGASLLLAGLSACSHRRHELPMSEERASAMREKMVERVATELTLNAAQKVKLGVLADKLKEQRAALIGSTTDPRAQLQALVAGAQFDRTRAQALVEEKTSAMRSKSPEVIAAMGDFFDSLNSAQQQQVRDFMQRGHGWMHR